jgi:hypothetical protein
MTSGCGDTGVGSIHGFRPRQCKTALPVVRPCRAPNQESRWALTLGSTRAVSFKRVSGSAAIVHHRVRFELDQPVGIDEARDLHDCVGRPNIAEELAVYCRYGLPVLDPGEERSCPHNMAQGRSSFLESRGDNLEASASLSRWIPFPYGLTIRAQGGCP